MRRSNLKSGRGTLLKNTAMLGLLQVSTYVLALIAVPYETRVLGPEVYGVLGVATAIMMYFQLVIDFGFALSSTEQVSRNREDVLLLRKVLTTTTLCKGALSVLSGAVLFVLCRCIGAWRNNTGVFMLFFVSSAFASMMPDYMYRGLEKMTAVTVRTVAIRGFFTGAIFIFLKRPEDLYVIPLLNIIGNGIAFFVSYLDLFRRFDLRLTRVKFGEVWAQLRSSAGFFLSRFATTAYTALNTLILDFMAVGGAATGFYTAADKLITTGRSALSPVSDSMYPYMARHRDFKLVRKVLLLLMPPIIAFCVACFIWAEPLCRLLLGEEYGPSGQVLRAMLPVAVLTLPNYILGFPTLTAMGLSKYANYSVILASVLHGVNLLILYLTGNISMISLALLVSLAEAVVLLFRIIVIVKNRDKMRPKEGETNG